MTRGISRDQKITPLKKDISRTLRREETPAEKKLWGLIRNRQLNGRKFRRQQLIDGFIADFYCPLLGLVIEIDGDIHAGREAYDLERTEHLRQRGLSVVRFTNQEILHGAEGVLERLYELTQ